MSEQPATNDVSAEHARKSQTTETSPATKLPESLETTAKPPESGVATATPEAAKPATSKGGGAGSTDRSFFKRFKDRVSFRKTTRSVPANGNIHLKEEQIEAVTKEVQSFKQCWLEHFNKGDIEQCVSGYTKDAIIFCCPTGAWRGRDNIRSCLTKAFKEEGIGETKWSSDQCFNVINESSCIVSGKWSTNKGEGITHCENWVKDADGSWKMLIDYFEMVPGVESK